MVAVLGYCYHCLSVWTLILCLRLLALCYSRANVTRAGTTRAHSLKEEPGAVVVPKSIRCRPSPGKSDGRRRVFQKARKQQMHGSTAGWQSVVMLAGPRSRY